MLIKVSTKAKFNDSVSWAYYCTVLWTNCDIETSAKTTVDTYRHERMLGKELPNTNYASVGIT